MERLVHVVEPLYDEHSKVLILGTFPSVKSREGRFFYHHPQNRFWKVLAMVVGEELPGTIEEKRKFLLRNNIAVWDVIHSCEITGSSDSSIKNVVPNDLQMIFDTASIQQIFVNGGKAGELYKRYVQKNVGREAVKLPSTSPANASYSLERLYDEWKQMAAYLK